MKQLKALILAVATLVTAQAWAVTDAQADKIRDRIKPVGTVCVGAECGAAVVVSAVARSGEEVYNTACAACHSVGVLNAPKKGDKNAWNDRYSKGESTLLNHAINGFNAMPPKGNCMNCSDDELLAAIKFMAGH